MTHLLTVILIMQTPIKTAPTILPPAAAALQKLSNAIDKVEKDGENARRAKTRLEKSKELMLKEIASMMAIGADLIEDQAHHSTEAVQDAFWEKMVPAQTLNFFTVPAGFNNPLLFLARDKFLALFLTKTDTASFFVRPLARFRQTFRPTETIDLKRLDLQHKNYTWAGVEIGWIFPDHAVFYARVWDKNPLSTTITCTRDLPRPLDAAPRPVSEWDFALWRAFLESRSDAETTVCPVTIMRRKLPAAGRITRHQ